MTLDEALFAPFREFMFMRRALAGSAILSLSAAPIGTMLVLRRMSLMGEAMSHAVLPGAALAFMLAGLSIPLMSLGGTLAGLLVAILAGLSSQHSDMKEDASFAGFFLIALALGVLLVSMQGSKLDLIHLLFGNVLAVDNAALSLMAGITTLSTLLMAVLIRPLMLHCLDPEFMRAQGGRGHWVHLAFLILVPLNLVAAFQAMGSLMAVGLMMLPAAAAQMWSESLGRRLLICWLLALSSSLAGLLLSYHANVPSGPAIILFAGLWYVLSLLLGHHGGMLPRWWRARHLEA